MRLSKVLSPFRRIILLATKFELMKSLVAVVSMQSIHNNVSGKQVHMISGLGF